MGNCCIKNNLSSSSENSNQKIPLFQQQSDPRYTLYNKFRLQYQQQWLIKNQIIYACQNSILYHTVPVKKHIKKYRDKEFAAKVTYYQSNEIECYQQLSHPNLVEVNDTFFNQYGMIIIMEYCSHGDLDDYLEQHSISLKEGLTIFGQLLECVQYLHQHKIAHRDLKLENILVRNVHPLEICVCDLGLSISEEQDSNISGDSQFVGSSCYLAPEIIQHIDYDPYLIDIWSLGVIGYILFQKEKPFSGETVSEIKYSIIDSHSELDWKIETPINLLLQKMLSKKPKLRPSASESLTLFKKLTVQSRKISPYSSSS